MTWAVAVGTGLSVISGIAGSSSKRKARKKAQAERNKMLQAQYTNELQQMQLEKGLQDYYSQLDKANTYKGRLNYAGYSSLSDYAPEYENTSTGIELPSKPTV